MSAVYIDPGPTPFDDLDQLGGRANRATKEGARWSNMLQPLIDSGERPLAEPVIVPQRRLTLKAGEGWTLTELPDIVAPREFASRRPTKWLSGATKKNLDLPPSEFLHSLFTGGTVWQHAHDAQVYEGLVQYATALQMNVSDAYAATVLSRAVVQALCIRAGCEPTVHSLAF